MRRWHSLRHPSIFIAGSPAARRNGRTLMTDSDKREPKPGDDEHVALSDPEFKDQLALVIPPLRAFGRSLSGNRAVADDLVKEKLMTTRGTRPPFPAATK